MKLPEDIFINILPYLNNHYNFSIVCKQFNELFRQYVLPTDQQIMNAFIRQLPNNTLQQIINNKKANITVGYNFPLHISSIVGNNKIVEKLLSDKRIRVCLYSDTLLENAIKHKQYDLFNILTSHKKIIFHNHIVRSIIENNQIEFIKIFLASSKSNKLFGEIVFWTIEYDKYEIMKLLVLDKRIIPHVQNGICLAKKYQNHNIEQLLFNFVEKVVKIII